MNLSNNLISEIENLDDLASLKELNLSANHIKEIKGLSRLKNLEVLNLGIRKEKLYEQGHGTDYNSDQKSNVIIEIKNLENLQKLRFLNLSGNHIQEIKNLNHLDLEDLREMGKSPMLLFYLPSVEHLLK